MHVSHLRAGADHVGACSRSGIVRGADGRPSVFRADGLADVAAILGTYYFAADIRTDFFADSDADFNANPAANFGPYSCSISSTYLSANPCADRCSDSAAHLSTIFRPNQASHFGGADSNPEHALADRCAYQLATGAIADGV